MSVSSGRDPRSSTSPSTHDRLIGEQFTRQAELFANALELHSDAQLALIVDAAAPKPSDVMLDVACGPGTVVGAFAGRVRSAIGLDATDAMLEQARALAATRGLANVEWRTGSVYRLPFGDGSFNVVTCRFAFHHFTDPAAALAEMVRVCRSGGRIVVCDGVCSPDPAKAATFNAMERHRDPSTASFLTFSTLMEIFARAGVPHPRTAAFQVRYDRDTLIAHSFPADDDRDGVRRMIDELIATDAMDVGSVAGETTFTYPTVVLTAVKT
ncbi:MAG TPA: methyltransferase domain-containing protein [Alphaproteobacteria bacterium]|jgi:ubiquinone/menaquinone biosynthesis C-methylase UbiE|nr:methyltransferase domain-containing protein [Alphaproteobacteria bacterium]